MVVSEEGTVVGSLSGGCVEGAVVEEALGVIAGGPARLLSFGYSDDEALSVGLTCGGILDIFVAPGISDAISAAGALIAEGRAVSLATVLTTTASNTAVEPGAAMAVVGGERISTLGSPSLDDQVARDLVEMPAGGTLRRRYQDGDGQMEVEVFLESFGSPKTMVILGAVDFSLSLCRLGRMLGYRVVVCDARQAFVTPERFPDASEVVVKWPHIFLAEIGGTLGPDDAICVLTHSEKFDVPALIAALGTKAGYIGAMGSRRTHERRSAMLSQAGVSQADLNRLMSPIGLDIGATEPDEVAVSICAEIIAVRSGKPVPSLQKGTGPIHSQQTPDVVMQNCATRSEPEDQWISM